MRKRLIAGNWKMNKTIPETCELIDALKSRLSGGCPVDVLVAPPFTALAVAGKLVAGSGIDLAGQNMFPKESGAFTGEISPVMLKDTGCRYVIIGHSERRHLLGETNELIHNKLLMAKTCELIPIFCVGETQAQRESGQTQHVIREQLESGLDGWEGIAGSQLVIAYEPVWAIGTGKHATAEQARDVHVFIRAWVRTRFGSQTADSIRILYGGSVSPSNSREFLVQPDIDGVLVGGASLDAESFYAIIESSY